MNYRIAKKILTYKSTLSYNPLAIFKAKCVMVECGKGRYMTMPNNGEHFIFMW